MNYLIEGIHLLSNKRLSFFESFSSKKDDAYITVELRFSPVFPKEFQILQEFYHSGLHVAILEEGWLYTLPEDPKVQLLVSQDYRTLYALESDDPNWEIKFSPLLRTALECARASLGIVSLHCSCVELEGKAVCFTAPSGTGKSTRARSWVEGLGAEFISGDRPTLYWENKKLMVSGAPWDGKEQIFRNVQKSVLAICDIRRSKVTRVSRLSVRQARKVLMRQCFIPMWDTEAASAVMASIVALAMKAPMYRVLCDRDEVAAEEVKKILFEEQDQIKGIEKDMKIKKGFVLRRPAGEYMVMPTNQNIEMFDGAIVLNEVSAFVWEKMLQSVSREELLCHIMAEFEVEEDVAAKDLDASLDKFRALGVMEDEDE